MNILNYLKNIFGKSAGSEKTKLSSEDGSKDLIGIGGSNGSNTWLIVILVLMLSASCFILGRCSVTPEIIQVPNVVIQPGIPDTTYSEPVNISGVSNRSQTHTTYSNKPDTIGLVIPELVETVVADTTQEGTINIRATGYPYLKGDTLAIDQFIEYNIQIRPIEITRTDTLIYPFPVKVPVEVPWIEKPEVVATGVSLAWLALLIILL